ncbi:hypothetical protein B472_16435 [Limnohabitans sp. Rim28]|nr:hypothetical protein B472_16435 [Limnohabitans sp. Rim28]
MCITRALQFFPFLKCGFFFNLHFARFLFAMIVRYLTFDIRAISDELSQFLLASAQCISIFCRFNEEGCESRAVLTVL